MTDCLLPILFLPANLLCATAKSSPTAEEQKVEICTKQNRNINAAHHGTLLLGVALRCRGDHFGLGNMNHSLVADTHAKNHRLYADLPATILSLRDGWSLRPSCGTSQPPEQKWTARYGHATTDLESTAPFRSLYLRLSVPLRAPAPDLVLIEHAKRTVMLLCTFPIINGLRKSSASRNRVVRTSEEDFRLVMTLKTQPHRIPQDFFQHLTYEPTHHISAVVCMVWCKRGVPTSEID